MPYRYWFHTYGWTSFDNNTATNPCSPVANTSSQWFCDFPNGTDSGYKQVNFQLFGISGDPNGNTPAYVTTNTSYVSATGTGVSVQDVVNTVNSSGCSGAYAGSNVVPANTKFVGNTTYITVTWPGGSPFINGDIIWVSGVGHASGQMFDVTGVQGQVVSNVSGDNFQYSPASGTATGTKTIFTQGGATVVNSTQSWPIPYENPYSAAWQAFVTAAIYHFNNLNNVASGSGWHLHQTSTQIGYIRPGVARGGEAIPLCSTSAPMTSPSSPFSAYSSTVWETWYATVNSAVQSGNPRMQIMYSINVGGDPASPNPLVATAEAGIAVTYSSSTGLHNGFGSRAAHWPRRGSSADSRSGPYRLDRHHLQRHSRNEL